MELLFVIKIVNFTATLFLYVDRNEKIKFELDLKLPRLRGVLEAWLLHTGVLTYHNYPVDTAFYEAFWRVLNNPSKRWQIEYLEIKYSKN